MKHETVTAVLGPQLQRLYRPRVSRKAKANFALYLRCYEVFGGGGTFDPFEDYVVAAKMAPRWSGVSAVRAFTAMEQTGTVTACRDPYRLGRALAGKKLLHRQMDDWIEGLNAGLFCLGEFMEGFPWLPPWVWKEIRARRDNSETASFAWYYKPLLDKTRERVHHMV